MRQTPLRQALVSRLRDEVARRGLTASDLSKRAGYDERTAQRLLNGDTCSWDTLERSENALRTDLLACHCPQEGKDGAGRSRTEQPEGPIVGWEQVARVLRVSRWTLRRKRMLYDSKREAWFANEAAVHFWYDSLISGDNGGEPAKGKGRGR